MDGAGFDEFRLDAFDVARVDVLDQCAGKAVFHAEQNADLFHAVVSADPGWPTECESARGVTTQCNEGFRARVCLRDRRGGRRDGEVGVEGELADEGVEFCACGVAGLFEISAVASGGLNVVFAAVELIDEALGVLIALEGGDVFASAGLVVGELLFFLLMCSDFAVEVADRLLGGDEGLELLFKFGRVLADGDEKRGAVVVGVDADAFGDIGAFADGKLGGVVRLDDEAEAVGGGRGFSRLVFGIEFGVMRRGCSRMMVRDSSAPLVTV